MATRKFYGKIGYTQGTVQSAPGVSVDNIIEISYYGDVIRNSRQMLDGQKVNDDLSVNNSISIVADAYAIENFFAMRYVQWMGILWIVSTVEVQSPRLLLTLGGVYNGPTP